LLSRLLKTFLPRLLANWVTLLGTVVATVAGLAILVLLVVGVAAPSSNPYLSIYVVVGLPIIFGLGLLLVPIGLYLDRHQTHEGADALQVAVQTVFSDRSARRRLIFVAVATVANIGIFALAGQKVIHHMDSPQFCGTSCHTAMQPEWEAYNRSAHSNVACVACHIGPGAVAEVKAKLNGVKQLLGVVTTNYHKPIVAGVHDLRPAKDTCQQCHSPQRSSPDKVKLFAHYDPDKANTPKFNAMLLRIGGFNRRKDKYEGIHWHANPDNQVTFEYLDPERRKIGKVTLASKGQTVAEYLPPGEPQKAIGVRKMDCIDCHNRPAHVFDGAPKDAVDRAIFLGALDPAMPYVAQVSTRLLGKTDIPREQAEEYFKTALPAAYKTDHPDVNPAPEALEKAAAVLAKIYLRNVFPAVKLGWNRHPSNLGHKQEGLENPGCFRCHDNAHVATRADGSKKKLSQSCDNCHTGLAFDANPDKFDDTLASMMPAGN